MRSARPVPVALLVLFVPAALAALAHPAADSRAEEPAPRARVADLAWLAGAWEGPLGAGTVEELWSEPRGGTLLGLGRVTRDERTVSFEYLRIEERAGGLVYVAQPGGGAPTEFRLTALDASHAVFENPAHDFPTTIRYERRADGGVTASIAGPDGQGQAFPLARPTRPAASSSSNTSGASGASESSGSSGAANDEPR